MKYQEAPEAKRTYQMRARAAAAEETHRRIVEAMVALYTERWFDRIALEEIATRAGVTMQTILRRFGSKEGLLAAAAEEQKRLVAQQRLAAPIDDVAGAIRNLFDHYEQFGDLVLRSLAQEDRYAPIRLLTDYGRQFHRDWVELVFAGRLAKVTGPDRERLRAQLVTVTDIYVWKLLCRDQGLGREQAELALHELIDGLDGGTGGQARGGGRHERG